MDQPALAIAVSSGEYRVLQANPRAKYIGSPYWSGSGAVLVEHWNAQAVLFARLMEVVDASLVEIRKSPERAHQTLAMRLGLDQSIAAQMGGYYFPQSSDNVDMAGISATVQALVDADLLDEPIPLEGFFPPGVYGMP
jgi:hypothetical protein